MVSIHEEYARKIVKRKGKTAICEGCGKEVVVGSEAMTYEIPFKGPRGYPLRKFLHVDCWQRRKDEAKQALEEQILWDLQNC